MRWRENCSANSGTEDPSWQWPSYICRCVQHIHDLHRAVEHIKASNAHVLTPSACISKAGNRLYSFTTAMHALHPEFFEVQGARLLRRAPSLNVMPFNRRYRSLFGTSPDVCTKLWKYIGESKLKKSLPVNLLWGLMLFKVYASEHIKCCIALVDEKTFRKWSEIFMKLLADISVVRQLSLLY